MLTRMRLGVASLMVSLVFASAGCAAAPAPTGRASRATLDDWVARHERPPAEGIHVSTQRHREHQARAHAPLERGGARIDVSFRQAPLSEALRLLASQARLQLVIADDLSGEVSLRLRRVRPYDALLALAEAHGADVLRDGDLVIVRAR